MGLFIFPKRQTGYNGWPLQSEVSRILKGVFSEHYYINTDSHLSTRYCGGLFVSEDHLKTTVMGHRDVLN